jgi:hypothetical protein
MPALGKALGAVKALEGFQFQMYGLNMELEVGEVLLALRTGT